MMQSVQRVKSEPSVATPAFGDPLVVADPGDGTKPEGLRERKRRESRATAQRIAIELCLEHGYDAVTVDMICDAANISVRTFYNYFGTREGALLGDSKPMPAAHHIADFVAARDMSDVEAFAVMMARVWTESEVDRETFMLRRRLLDATPALAALNMARVSEARGQYAAIARERLEVVRPGLANEGYEVESALLVTLALGALQNVARTWLSGEDDTPLDTLMYDYFPRVRRLTQAFTAT